MFGLGTILNMAGVVAGGVTGMFLGKLMSERFQDIVMKCSGLVVIIMALGGTLEKCLKVGSDGAIHYEGTMLLVASLILGSIIGEAINLEQRFENFGEWLKRKTHNEKEAGFVDGFVTCSLTVCVGAMAIVGSIQDGIFGDYSTLAVKAVLDFIIVLVMTTAMGKGCMFAAIPIGLLQGSVTILARFAGDFLSAQALDNIGFVGSVLISCVGVNIIQKTFKVANMLPALIVAVVCAYLPFF